MKVVCSYCKKFLREKPPLDDDRVSHGVCGPCYERFTEQLRGMPLDAYLNGFDAPVLVVRDDARVIALNRAMGSMLGKQSCEALGLLGGEALECAFAGLPGGCGQTAHCETCTIRRTVEVAIETGKPTFDAPAYMVTKRGRVALRISTVPIDGVVRVTIREVPPLATDDRVND